MFRPHTRSVSLAANVAQIALPMDKDQANCTLIVPATKPAVVAVTPQKRKLASKSKEKIYFRVTLKDHPSQFIAGKAALERFKSDYGTLVVKVYGYSSKKAFDDMKKKHEDQPINPKIVADITKSGASDLARSIIEEMVDDSDRDAFRGLYYITSDSPLCILVIRLTGQKGDEHWCWKPDIMTKIMTKIFKRTDGYDTVIKSAFENLTFAPSPDPDDITRETQRILSYIPKNTTRTVTVNIYVAYTHFTVPFANLASKDEEKEYIHSKIKTFFNEMKVIMLSPTFKTVMESVSQNYSDKIFDKARTGNNLFSFLNKAGIRVSSTSEIASHFTRPTTEYLMGKLFAARLPTVKYVTADVPPEEHVDTEYDYESGEDDEEAENET